MSNYDASIRVNTKVDTSQMQRLQIQIDKATVKIESLTKKYDELKKKSNVPTKEYDILAAKLSNAKYVLESFVEEQKKLSDKGFGTDLDKNIATAYQNVKLLKAELEQAVTNRNADEYLAIEDRLNRAKAIMQELMNGSKHPLGDIMYYESIVQKLNSSKNEVAGIEAEMQKLEETGKAFTFTDTSKEAEKVEKELSIAKKELHALLTKQKELNRVAGHTPEGYRKLASSARGAFNTLVTGSRKAHGPLTKVQQRLSSIAMSALLFNQVSRGLNSAVNGAKEGFQNLAKYSSETNKVMSEFKGEIETTKNSLAVAFEPIVTTVVPYLTQFLDVVNSAGNSLAWFLAILSGKNTYKRAKDQVVDYAESLNTAGSAAKNALASFDDLNTLAQSGSGSGSTSSDMFEEVETGVPDDWTAGLVDAINMGDWESAGKLLAEKLNNSAEQIDYYKIGATIGKGLTNAFAAGNGFLSNVDTLSIGAGLATMLNTAMENLDEELVGETAAETINRIFDAAFGFLSTFDFKSAGLELGGIINGFFENVDFGEAGQNVSLLAAGILEFFTNAVEETNWSAVGEKIGEFFANIDWYGVLCLAGKAVQTALNALFDVALGMLKGSGIFDPISSIFNTEEVADALTQEIQDNYRGILDEFESLKDIADEYYTMSQNYDTLTDAQKQKLQEYSDTIARELGEEAVRNIDSVTGAYKGTKDELYKLINATEAYYMTLTAQGTIEKLYGQIFEAEMNLSTATEGFEESYNRAMASYYDYMVGRGEDFAKLADEATDIFAEAWYGAGETVEERAQAIVDQMDHFKGTFSNYTERLIESYDEATAQAILDTYEFAQQILESSETIDTASLQVANAQNIVDAYANDVVVAGGTMSNAWATGTTSLQRHTQETQSSMSTMSNAWATGSIIAKRTASDNQTAVTDISTAWQNGENDVCLAVDNLTDGIKCSFNSAYDEIKTKSQELLDDLHKMFDEYSIGVSGAAIGGAAFVGQIPRLATGGIATSSVLANIGESGREAVLPLENNTEWMDMLADKFGTDRPIVINFEGNLAQLGRVLKPVIDAENRRIGHSFLKN